MSDRPCMLNPEKWRVAQYVVQVPVKEAIARPWQLQAPAPASPLTYSVAVWGIWPPQWDISAQPLLSFPSNANGWRQAFRAAWDRAQFASVPPIKQRTELIIPEDFDPAEPAWPVKEYITYETYTPQFSDEDPNV